MEKSKVMSVGSALDLIRDEDCIAISSAGLIGYPDYIACALEERFMNTGHPRDLSLYSGCGHGVPFLHEGDARFAHPGFLKKVICSHPDPVPGIRKMIEENAFQAYILPQGVLQHLYRCAAAREPGLLTKIGIGTYIDPRQEGGKANSITTEDIVRVMEIDGEEWLYYKAFPVTAAIIRGTTADEHGNVSIEHEALKLELLEIAMAAKARKGKVIVQVERVAENGTIKPKDVVVPGELVDAVVVVDDVAKHHRQTAATVYNPYLSGEARAPVSAAGTDEPAELQANDIVCRKALYELFPGAVVNVGVGIGAGIGDLARAEGIERDLTFTLELGAFGGAPQSKADFGATMNPTAFVAHPSMFDFYHGGGLDITFLGAAQIDREGNVNSSKFGGHVAGQGGFIDISQSSRKVVFCTYFTAKGLKASVKNGGLVIEQEGEVPKLVEKVDQITFSAKTAVEMGKPVLYVTERGVFELTPDGIMLTEVAPGVDVEKDIVANMGFRPLISGDLKQMDERIFTPAKMGYAKDFFAKLEN
ncbi:MAG: acyl CoA:acetate/3-ketoacid CoA transferase [Oscillospiraceae bacterium]